MVHTCQVTRPRSPSSFRVNPQEPRHLMGIPSFSSTLEQDWGRWFPRRQGEIGEMGAELETSQWVPGGALQVFLSSLKVPIS